MTEIWDEARLQQYIDDGIEESLNLDYKDARSIAKSDGKKREITKDVSAMANSDGGIIIYGIAEYQDKEQEHLPEKITPIDRRAFSKEWLEQIINNIQPRINGVHVEGINLNSGGNDVAYVVEVPKSNTAHQALDKKYYKRFNFISEPMYDYEIRDVMGRGQYPRIELGFDFYIETGTYFFQNSQEEKRLSNTYLRISAYNRGSVFANYLNAFFHVPKWILDIPDKLSTRNLDDDEYYTPELQAMSETIYAENSQKSLIYSDSRREDGEFLYSPPVVEPPRNEPLLPDRRHIWLIEVRDDIQAVDLTGLEVTWEIFADNSGKNSGQILLAEIEFIEQEREI